MRKRIIDYLVVVLIIFVLFVIRLGFRKIDKFQDYNYTVLVKNNIFNNDTNIELYKNVKIKSEFVASYDNLGIISFRFDTHNRLNNDYLEFRIREKGEDAWYYSNKYKVDQFQDRKYFPFGFPEINNSRFKKYEVEIESLSGNLSNNVQLMRNDSDFLTKYSFSKEYLLKNKNLIPKFLYWKVVSFFTHIRVLEYLGMFCLSLICGFLYIKFNVRKTCKWLKLKYKKSILRNKYFFLDEDIQNRMKNMVITTLSLIYLFLINFLINNPIRLKVIAYADDLWNLMFFNVNKGNYLSMIFNLESNKLRPFFNFIFFGLFYLFEGKYWLFGYLNILISFCIAGFLFLVFRKIVKNNIIAVLLSSAFIFSRFAYYDISQVLGIMESMALLLSILLVYNLWIFLNIGKYKYFWFSLLFYLLLLFTHERFFTFIVLYIFIFVFSKKIRSNKGLLVCPLVPILLNFSIRFLFFKDRILDGTGGTSILDTFNIFVFKNYFFSGWLNIIGINDGPSILNGIAKEYVPLNINIFVWLGILCIMVIFLLYLFCLICEESVKRVKAINNFLLFMLFIICSLISASVTIRLEMRWLYVPFVGFLFLMAQAIDLIRIKRIFYKLTYIVLFIWFFAFLITQVFYRRNYGNIYYWNDQLYGNALYEAVVEKYKKNFSNFDIYIICQKDPISISNCKKLNELISQYDKNKKITLLEDSIDIKLNQFKKDTLILKYDENKRVFLRI